VREASFSVAEGEVFGIVGGSGSGKTTTLRAILRRLPRGAHILGGEVRYRGRDLLALSEKELRGVRGSKVAIIVQNPIAALNPLHRVGTQVRSIARQHRRTLGDEQMQQLMRDVGIIDPQRVLRAYPHELSGGMAQRVLIAVALSLEPELILADEPTSALDVTIQAQIMELVTGLVKQRGLTFALVTHDIALVSE
jgi:ABC-type dipeptide/oligopeptide/nickel transport system ATPase component